MRINLFFFPRSCESMSMRKNEDLLYSSGWWKIYPADFRAIAAPSGIAMQPWHDIPGRRVCCVDLLVGAYFAGRDSFFKRLCQPIIVRNLRLHLSIGTEAGTSRNMS